MSVSLDNLKIFCDVARKKSFSRAAQLNNVTQSAASQVVLQMEKRLNVLLIDRSKRPLALTSEGQIYYNGCREIVDRYSDLESQIHAFPKEENSTITVASIYSVSLYDMNQYTQKFEALFPGRKVRIDYMHPNEVYDSVLLDESDLGLISFPRSLRTLEVIPWRLETMVFVCSTIHRFANLAQIDPIQIEHENFVTFNSELDIRRHLDNYLRQQKVKVNIVMEFDNIEAIKRGVEVNAGVSILPEPTVRSEVEKGSLAKVFLTGDTWERSVGIIHRRKKILTPAMKSFVELLKKGEPEHSRECANELVSVK